jgi:hypothetical protein
MLKRLCALTAVTLALAMPALAQDKAATVDERAFAADYKALLKKHPGATYRFHLFDEGEAKPGPSPRCGSPCEWTDEVGVCSCPRPGKPIW